VKRYLKPLLHGSSSFNRKVLAAIEKKDPSNFLECYTEHPEWREDFIRLIKICLGVLANTGVDSGGALNALHTSKDGSAVIVTLPKRLYPWAKILKDSAKSFTLAVFADTCLSVGAAMSGRTCGDQGDDGDDNVVLETRLCFPDVHIAPKSPTKSDESSDKQYRIILSHVRDKRLFLDIRSHVREKRLSYDIDIGMIGYLEITDTRLIAPHNTSDLQPAFIARWTHGSTFASLFQTVKSSKFSECLVKDSRRYFTTHIISAEGKKHEKTE
jgi:hypothetical protein